MFFRGFGGAVPRAGHPSWPKPRPAPKRLDGASDARARAEEELRNKWLAELRVIVVGAGLPIVILMQGFVQDAAAPAPWSLDRLCMCFAGGCLHLYSAWT